MLIVAEQLEGRMIVKTQIKDSHDKYVYNDKIREDISYKVWTWSWLRILYSHNIMQVVVIGHYEALYEAICV